MNEEQNIAGFIEEVLNLHRRHLISRTHKHRGICKKISKRCDCPFFKGEQVNAGCLKTRLLCSWRAAATGARAVQSAPNLELLNILLTGSSV